MNKNFIRNVLEDYLQALYRGGTEEEQDKVKEALGEVDNDKETIDINNGEHPSRKKAINIMYFIASYIGHPEIFDCKDGNTTWYDVEDKLTNIIEGN